ncbi:MAG TPA: hypothetical protein PLY73_10690 [Candidatus Ozemobacteraceae bacterium]|nr:hypothetical protein [Candidatus Ozemobacteraceae bacterium]
MLKKLVIRMMAVVVIASGISACFAQGAGRAYEEAIKSRATGTIEEVTAKFMEAAEQTSDKTQKGFVLSSLAEFLMEKEEWASAANVYQRVMREGADANIPGACYGAAQAWVMMGNHDHAKKLCKMLKAKYPASGIEEFANQMKADAPDSVHALLAEYLAEFEGVTGEDVDVTALPGEKEPVAEVPAPGEPAPAAASTSEPAPAVPVASAAEPVAEETAEAVVEEKGVSGQPRITLQFRGWQSDLSGRMESRGMNLDLADETSIDEQNRFAMKAAWNISRRNQLRFDYMHFDHSGFLKKNMTFDNLNYGFGALLNIEARFFDAGFARLIRETGDVAWRILFGGKMSHAFMHVEQRVSSGFRSGELSQDFPIPYVGFEGHGKINANAAFNASLKYFTVEQGDTAGDLTDLDMAFLIGRDYAKMPSETEWYGSLGYRYFLLRGRTADETVKVSYAGPTFGVESRF